MSRYIDEAVEADVLLLLNDWASGMYGSKLTWATLEKASDFTRQALAARPNIYNAYAEAKKAIRGGGAVSPSKELQAELDRARKKIKQMENEIEQYRNLWVLWTYNAETAGIDLNRPMPKGFKDSQRDR